MSRSQAQKAVLAAGVYFLLCGIGAVFFPASWYFICGLQQPELPNPFLTTTGAMMIALGLGGIQTSFQEAAKALLPTLIAANIIDAVVVLFYLLSGPLPPVNGAVLLAIDLAWTLFLIRSSLGEKT